MNHTHIEKIQETKRFQLSEYLTQNNIIHTYGERFNILISCISKQNRSYIISIASLPYCIAMIQTNALVYELMPKIQNGEEIIYLDECSASSDDLVDILNLIQNVKDRMDKYFEVINDIQVY